MRTATTVEGSAGNWPEITEFVCEAEKLGLDICWVAEAWGTDAPSTLGYLAARTGSMLLGSAVIQVGTRSPVVIAQTAMTLAHLSGGRFLLGLGVSGPQVIEGLHGVPFAHPLARMRETVQIARSVFAGEKVSFQGTQHQIPLPGGEGRPMRVSVAPVSVPVYLAALSPGMLELTGELADGWLGTSFVPEGAAAYFGPLDAGLARAGRTRADLDICQGAEVELRGRGRPGAGRGRPEEGAGVFAGRHGVGGHQLFQRRLQPPGMGRRGRRGPRALAGRGPRRRRGPDHRRDGPGHHAHRHRGHGAGPPADLARQRSRTPCACTRRGTRSPPGWTTWPGPSTSPGRSGSGASGG